jgi:hypothetical protein
VEIFRRLGPHRDYLLIWSDSIYEGTIETAVLAGARGGIYTGGLTSADIERLRNAIREHRAAPAQESGWNMDDNLEGFGEVKPYSVSTLVPGLHGKPLYRYFDTLEEALSYARDRARKGKPMRAGGKAYFVLNATPIGPSVYRVFRGIIGADPNAKRYTEKHESVIVQKLVGGGAQPTHVPQVDRWLIDRSLSVEILDVETEKTRKQKPRSEPVHVRISQATRNKAKER